LSDLFSRDNKASQVGSVDVVPAIGQRHSVTHLAPAAGGLLQPRPLTILSRPEACRITDFSQDAPIPAVVGWADDNVVVTQQIHRPLDEGHRTSGLSTPEQHIARH
jgi:hypothetical protein